MGMAFDIKDIDFSEYYKIKIVENSWAGYNYKEFVDFKIMFIFWTDKLSEEFFQKELWNSNTDPGLHAKRIISNIVSKEYVGLL